MISIISIKPVAKADRSVVAKNQVEMDLISHNSTCDLGVQPQGHFNSAAKDLYSLFGKYEIYCRHEYTKFYQIFFNYLNLWSWFVELEKPSISREIMSVTSRSAAVTGGQLCLAVRSQPTHPIGKYATREIWE